VIPKSLAKTVQLIVLLLLVSAGINIVLAYTRGLMQIVVFAGAVVVIGLLWSRLDLRRYFFGD
jgi:hypothetical protein